VFITTTPVFGTRYLLIGDPDNHALPDALRITWGSPAEWTARWTESATRSCSHQRYGGGGAVIWRSTVLIVAAFAAAAIVIWLAPRLLAPLGLGEFAFVGQLGLAVLVLSVLDKVFTRLPGSADHHPPPGP